MAAYARALGLRNALPSIGNAPGSIGEDLKTIVALISGVLGDQSVDFNVPRELLWRR